MSVSTFSPSIGGVCRFSPAPGRPTVGHPDPWGYGQGTQAAGINRLLAGGGFRSITDVYAELVRAFPRTTRARVNTHIAVLRRHHRACLLEKRDGRWVAFRLLVPRSGRHTGPVHHRAERREGSLSQA